MPPWRDLVLVKTLPATLENAWMIQKLTLQDLLAGGFANPTALANPADPRLVAVQRNKLAEHPERYSGFVRNGTLVAYLKQNYWLRGDELPFASGLRATLLRSRRALRLDPAVRGNWGIFGLVASADLSESEQKLVLFSLLEHAVASADARKLSTVNLVMHGHDPLLQIARDYGFEPTDTPGEAAGAPGLIQRRYQRQSLR